MVMAWQARHGAWHSNGMALLVRHDICMAWGPWHGICYGLAGITWYMVWPGGHRMVYGMAWRGMPWYVEMYSITCFKTLPWAIVPFTRGVADVSKTVGGLVHTYRNLSHVQLLFTLGKDSK